MRTDPWLGCGGFSRWLSGKDMTRALGQLEDAGQYQRPTTGASIGSKRFGEPSGSFGQNPKAGHPKALALQQLLFRE